MKRSALKRKTRLKPMSDKLRTDLPRRKAEREAVLERDRGCMLAEALKQRPDFPPHKCRGPLVPNHAWKSGQGGPYVRANLDAVCWGGNDWIERWPIEAKWLGFVR